MMNRLVFRLNFLLNNGGKEWEKWEMVSLLRKFFDKKSFFMRKVISKQKSLIFRDSRSIFQVSMT